MKRFISVLLAVLMVLSLSACEARENKIAQEKAAKVDEMIYNLGTITINSRIPIEKAEAAYEALDERAKGFVTRHQELVDARTEFLSIRRQTIVDRVEEAKAKFEETLDARAYFLTLYDTRKDCHEGEFDVVDDAVKAAEELCYPGTHFIKLQKVMEKGGITVNEGNVATYTNDLGSFTAYFTEGGQIFGDLSEVSEVVGYTFDNTAYGSAKDGSVVWGEAARLYSEHLGAYNMKQADITWGDATKIGQSGIIYVDDRGNELQFMFTNNAYSYYYQLLLKTVSE